ncbi:MAG: hypothetical protein ACJ754_27130 [Pyrinomonadaceae bacterium]|jgi:hypothetical protein
MSTDPRIRVIKLAERKRRAKARIKQGRDAARHPGPGKTREAADTITGWIDELRQQKQQSADAASDFNNLFEDAT